MTAHLIQVETRSHPGQDEVFNRRYDDVHIADVLTVPEVRGCRRYKIVGQPGQPARYIAHYEPDCDDPEELLKRLLEASKAMVISPALDLGAVMVTILKPI
jgi:hypothetical protein